MTPDDREAVVALTVLGFLVLALVIPWDQPGKWLNWAASRLRRRLK